MNYVAIQDTIDLRFLSASQRATAAMFVLLSTESEAVCHDEEVLIDTVLIASFELTRLISAYNADDC